MKMWFHQGNREMFLFREWVPNNSECWLCLRRKVLV